MIHKLLRDKLMEFQTDGFEFLFFEKAGYYHYEEKKDVLSNGVFEPLPLSEMKNIRLDEDGRLLFRLHGDNYTLIPVKTIIGRF